MVDRSLFNPTIDNLVFRVALEYENLYIGAFTKLDPNSIASTKRRDIMAKTGIGYTQRSDSEFILYLKLLPYIVKVDGEHYLFNGVPIGRMFNIKENLIAFTGPPKILAKEDYHHPHVYVGNIIDYSTEDRWDRSDIRWCHWYDATKTSTMHKMGRWLEEGRIALQEGYTTGIIPVHLLNRDKFPSEYRTSEEAARSGVKIFLNR